MKIVLAQTKFHKANIAKNCEVILQDIENAKTKNVSLIIFPEMATTAGYVGTLTQYSDFEIELNKAFESLKTASKNIDILIGSYNICNNQFRNAILLFQNGEMTHLLNRADTKNYTSKFSHKNTDFEVCFYKNIEQISNSKSDNFIVYGDTPFTINLRNQRIEKLQNIAKSQKIRTIYINNVGAFDNEIFDGGSLIINKNGEVIKELNLFSEEIYLSSNQEDIINKDKNYAEEYLILEALKLAINSYFSTIGVKKAVIGLSGGIDSAVVAAVAVLALGAENVHGILMPSDFSTDHSISDAEVLAKNLGMTYDTVSIKDAYKAINTSLEPIWKEKKFDVTEENIQARIRAIFLMAYSNKNGHLVLNTSNKSEASVGYGTLYGDLSGSLSILGDLYKHQVYNLAKFINSEREIIPQNSITKEPSGELSPNQKDTDSLPEYDILDAILFQHLENRKSGFEIVEMGYNREIVEKILKMIRRNEYKRFQYPPIIKISEFAYTVDRKMPLNWDI